MDIPDLQDAMRLDCDVLVIGGGTAGTMAALSAAERGAQVILLESGVIRKAPDDLAATFDTSFVK